MRQLSSILAVLGLLVSTQLLASHTDEYIYGYKDIAQQEMQRSGIPASIILAQGIHESAWGRGALAVNSNNHFGIKCKDYWEGPTYYHKDDDYVNGKLIKSCFRAYENVEESYIDHTDFLLQTKYYQDLFDYDETDYRNWAYGLKRCGYATDPAYAEKIIGIIEKYRLYEFDQVSFYDVSDLVISKPVVVMDAPSYHIPEVFNQNTAQHIVLADFTPSSGIDHPVATASETFVPPSQEQSDNFEYEVITTPVLKEDPVRVPLQQTTYAVDHPQPNVVLPATGSSTAMMPNPTSKDRRLKNLSRRPRMSHSNAGPR